MAVLPLASRFAMAARRHSALIPEIYMNGLTGREGFIGHKETENLL